MILQGIIVGPLIDKARLFGRELTQNIKYIRKISSCPTQ